MQQYIYIELIIADNIRLKNRSQHQHQHHKKLIFLQEILHNKQKTKCARKLFNYNGILIHNIFCLMVLNDIS